jgi:transcription antitermination factor NusG
LIPLYKNPPTRFPDRPILDTTLPWWVAKVKPRQEKALASDLIERNIEYYLPMYTKVTRRKDNNKPRKSVLCLFPGYLSFCTDKGFEREIYTTDRIVTIIQVKNQSHFRKELSQIYYALEHNLPIEPLDPQNLVPGQFVEVVHGPMRGIQGHIVKLHSGHKLILSVDLLGKAAVSIDSSLVKPLEDRNNPL